MDNLEKLDRVLAIDDPCAEVSRIRKQLLKARDVLNHQKLSEVVTTEVVSGELAINGQRLATLATYQDALAKEPVDPTVLGRINRFIDRWRAEEFKIQSWGQDKAAVPAIDPPSLDGPDDYSEPPELQAAPLPDIFVAPTKGQNSPIPPPDTTG